MEKYDRQLFDYIVNSSDPHSGMVIVGIMGCVVLEVASTTRIGMGQAHQQLLVFLQRLHSI